MNKKNIGKNIQSLRKEAGMTPAELAESTNVSTDCIKNTEAGSDTLSLSLLLGICETLNTTPNDILAGEYPSDCSEENRLSLTAGQNNHEDPYEGIKEEDAMLLKSMHYFMANRREK